MSRLLCAVLFLISMASPPALADRSFTATSGHVLNLPHGGPAAGSEVGLIRKSVVEASPPGISIVPDKRTLVEGDGSYVLMVNGNEASYHAFYVFTINRWRYNEIYDDVDSSLALPFPEDFSQPGVVLLDGRVDNPGIDFDLESNKTTEFVLMRDGVTHLATDILRASRTVPAPTILERTPYNKNILNSGTHYVTHGYHVAVQDVRGRFASEGRYAPYRNDGWGATRDGYDTIEWIAAQPWSDGQVGMIGTSAGGINQLLAAGATPPSLVCCYSVVGSGDLYDVFFTGGVFRKRLTIGWLEYQNEMEYLPRFLAHPHRDPYWDAVDISTRLPEIQVPFYHLTGWFDIMEDQAVKAFAQLQDHGGPGARDQQKLLVGPWSHWGLYERDQGELTFPPNAVWSTDFALQNELDFFDYWMKGAENGFYDAPPVRYYTMGDVDDPQAPGNEWRTADSWPPLALEVPFHLGSDGSLSEELPTGAATRPVPFVSDPRTPVQTIGGANLWLPQGPYDQSTNELRDDVLTFTTEPLLEPLEVTGELRAELYISSTAPDTDFMVKLCDVYPDGRSMLIQEGAIRARHHESLRYERLLTPGEIYLLEIDLWGTSIVFNAGHRIRVSVTSSNAPRWDLNPNTGQPFREHTYYRRAENTVYCGGSNASRVILPVVRCDDPVNYCATSPNSVGPGATLSWLGTPSRAADDLQLVALGCPPHQLGFFFYGASQVALPFGEGLRCVGADEAGFFRFAAQHTDLFGGAFLPIDCGAPPAGSGPGELIPGESWNFQWWYRDPNGGAHGFNLSDGLLVEICP